MAKRKRTNEQTMIYKTLHRKERSSNTNPTKKPEGELVRWKGKQFLFHMWHRRYTLLTKPCAS